jgi:signal transduction histidine kinase
MTEGAVHRDSPTGAPGATRPDALALLNAVAAYLESAHEEQRSDTAERLQRDLGGLLVALKMDLNWLDLRLAAHPALQAKCLGMGRAVDRAVECLGQIATDLRPSILDHEGLWAAIEWQAQEFFDATGLARDIQVHISAGIDPPAGVHGSAWATAVFRVFQQLLGNVARHADAQSVRVRLHVDGAPAPVLHLEISDDGLGAASVAVEGPSAVGIAAIRARAERFGGRLVVRSQPLQGTRATLSMPLPVERGDGDGDGDGDGQGALP